MVFLFFCIGHAFHGFVLRAPRVLSPKPRGFCIGGVPPLVGSLWPGVRSGIAFLILLFVRPAGNSGGRVSRHLFLCLFQGLLSLDLECRLVGGV